MGTRWEWNRGYLSELVFDSRGNRRDSRGDAASMGTYGAEMMIRRRNERRGGPKAQGVA